MVRKRSNSLFLVINVVISIAIALLAIAIYSATQGEEEPRARPTIVLVVTATPDPNQTLSAGELQSTVDAQAGTLSAQARQLQNAQEVIAALENQDSAEGQSGGNIPPQQPQTQADGQDTNLPTIDPALIPPIPGAGGGEDPASTRVSASASPLPEDGCERYYVQQGDTASTIASRKGVTLADLFVLNGINDRTVLQIGDELLIPSDSCEPQIPPTPTPTPRPTIDLNLNARTPSPSPIAIDPDSEVEIVQILNPGDVTAEQVEIQNLGSEINLGGWTLSDEQGNIYTFPQIRLIPGSVIRVSTRTSPDTPGFLYWNLNIPVWEAGEIATLSNADGVVQSFISVGGEVIDFGDN